MIALDLFAGTGWGVACQQLGIEELGVEIMAEAVATRDANGMKTIFRDVWEGLDGSQIVPDHDLLIASPPCQTYSLAGNGAGRAALNEVYEAISTGSYRDYARMEAFVETHDDRTALVLAPLAYAVNHMPRFIAWEQVPTVLPVWEACAEVLRGLGYSVTAGVLNAEQYGVPQTRKRAVLVAQYDGVANLPVPTHSRYYPRTPDRFDVGVLPWVSMADALGFDDGRRYTQNNKLAHQSVRPLTHPAPTVTAGHDSGNRGFLDVNNVLEVATPEQVALLQSYPVRRGLTDRPAPTITGGGTETGGAEPVAKWHQRYTAAPGWIGPTDRLTPGECATLQTYPPFEFSGSKTKQYLQIGNAVPPVLARAILGTFQ